MFWTPETQKKGHMARCSPGGLAARYRDGPGGGKRPGSGGRARTRGPCEPDPGSATSTGGGTTRSGRGDLPFQTKRLGQHGTRQPFWAGHPKRTDLPVDYIQSFYIPMHIYIYIKVNTLVEFCNIRMRPPKLGDPHRL